MDYPHPLLPCGYNADDNNGDEVDGAGTNWAISPVLFDSFEGLIPIIVTEDMLAAFDECPDYVAPCVNNILQFPIEVSVWNIPSTWHDHVIVAVNDTLVIPAEASVLKVRDKGASLTVPGVVDGVTVPLEVREHGIARRRA